MNAVINLQIPGTQGTPISVEQFPKSKKKNCAVDLNAKLVR
jgi:hypothetical protein